MNAREPAGGLRSWQGAQVETVRINGLTGLRPSRRARLQAAQREAAGVWTLGRDMHVTARLNRTTWLTQGDLHRATRRACRSTTCQLAGPPRRQAPGRVAKKL